MANQLIEIETSNDFFCGGDREININSKREKEKHLTLLSRPGKPHESYLDQLVSPTPLASASQNSSTSSRSNSNWTAAERRQFVENKIADNVARLVTHPGEIYHINVSVYRPNASKPERLTVNVDFIFDQGTKPFKTSANCVSRSRMREITANVTKHWGGYDYAREVLQAHENFYVFAGKLKNRKQHKALIPQRVIPRTLIIVNPVNNTLQLIIDEVSYDIDLITETNPKSTKFFQLRGSVQSITDKEWDI
jgi:hypothetical protein